MSGSVDTLIVVVALELRYKPVEDEHVLLLLLSKPLELQADGADRKSKLGSDEKNFHVFGPG